MPLSFLLALALLASPSPLERSRATEPVDDCEALLAAAPDFTPERAPLLARGAAQCGDPVLAFALTERALKLQPHSVPLRLAHARSLLALGERGAAAQLLDRGIADPGAATAPLRLLRAELALAEAEPERVEALLAPLPASAAALSLRAQARAQLQARAAARELLAQHDRDQALREQEAAAAPEGGEPEALPSGREVWSTRGSVESGGQRTFRLRGVRAGGHYVLLVTGHCRVAQPQKKRRRSSPAPRELFGVDFRARVGSLEAWPLSVGLEPERSAYTFRSPEDAPQLFVEDRSAPRTGVRCSVRDLAVRVP